MFRQTGNSAAIPPNTREAGSCHICLQGRQLSVMAIRLATKRIFLTCLVVSVVSSAVLGIAAMVFQQNWRVQQRLIMTAVVTGLYSLGALAASIPFDRGHWRVASGAGIATLVIAFVLTVPVVWLPQLEDSDAYGRFVGSIATIGGLLAHMSLISMARVSSRFRWLQLLTIVSSFLLATTIIGMIIVNPSYPNSQLWATSIGLCVLLAACGSIVIPIAQVLNRIQTAEQVETVDLEMTIICPRCRLQQVVASGPCICAQCKLRFKIEIEEPRCEKCGYLLYQLTENRCPECGQVFGAELVAE